MHRRTRKTDERGAVLALSAVAMVVAMIAGALAIDLGFLAEEARRNQKVADLAALDAVRVLPANPTAAARTSACNSRTDAVRPGNAFPCTKPGYSLDVQWSANKTGPWSVSAADLPGAAYVRVTARSPHENKFPFVPGGQNTIRSAVARSQAEAAFSVGSTLASLDTQKSRLDPILGGMLDLTAVQMNAVSYDGLATGNVSLAALQTRLLAMGYDVGTPEKLLAQELKVSDLFTATASALTAQGSNVAAAELNKIPILTIPSVNRVTLGRLVNLSQPGSASALDTTINAFNIVNGSAQVANGTSFISVPGISVTVPGVATVTTAIRVIEPAQTARGPVGTVAKNSQVVLRLNLDLLPVIGGTGTLNIDFSAGAAKATLTDISCSTTPPSITLDPETSGATVTGNGVVLGLLPALGGTLTVTGNLVRTAPTPPDPRFDYPNEFVPPVGPSPAHSEHVGAATLNLNPAAVDVVGSGGLTATTVGLALDAAMPLVLSTVTPVLQTLLQPVLKTLGLDLAGADLTAIGIYEPPPLCAGPRLAV